MCPWKRRCPLLHCDHSPLLLFGLLHNFLHDLLFLNQESANHTVLDTVGATAATIGALYGLFGARDGGILAGSEGWNLCREQTYQYIHFQFVQHFLYWLLLWEELRRTPASFMPQSPHFGAVPLFLICRYLCSPPGVLITRTLLETVLYGCRLRYFPPSVSFQAAKYALLRLPKNFGQSEKGSLGAHTYVSLVDGILTISIDLRSSCL